MPSRRFAGIRWRIFLIIIVSILPAAAFILYGAAERRQHEMKSAARQVSQLAGVLADDIGRTVNETDTLLRVISRLPEVAEDRGAACPALLADIRLRDPRYANLGAAGASGCVFCSAQPLAGPVTAADRTYFREAMKTGGFTAGEFQVGRITGLPVFVFGYPITDKDGRPQGAVFAALDLAWLNRHLAGLSHPLGLGTTLALVDRSGTILARHPEGPEGEKWAGRALPENLLAPVLSQPEGMNLAESEERFRNLVESTSDWVWEVNEDGFYTYASPKVRDLLGYEPEEVIGKTPFDLMPPEEASRVAEIFSRVAACREPFASLENVNRRRDGRLVVLETSGVPFFDADGRFRGYRGIDREITERKKAEARLKESEAKFQSIASAASDAVILLDDEGRLTFWNESAEKMFGRNAEDVAGRTMHLLFAPMRYHEAYRKGYSGFARTGEGPVVGKTLEIEALRRDGTEFPIELSVSAVLIGDRWHAVGIIRDITQRKRAEEELRAHVDELERFRRATVDREFRIKELRDRIAALEDELARRRDSGDRSASPSL
ncbi:MAG: PAS domain S-box protein [Nitrospirae bacterium]|nr:PAS domain S-box protein [Nitrospirota bacterium]